MIRFSYGKQDWKTLERGEENCYLMTNGLGGFSSLSIVASCSRNDQAVLMSCVHSPNHRYNMIHRLEEVLELDSGESQAVPGQDPAGMACPGTGCFAQGWSVGEILRVYDTLRMLDEQDAAAEETE